MALLGPHAPELTADPILTEEIILIEILEISKIIFCNISIREKGLVGALISWHVILFPDPKLTHSREIMTVLIFSVYFRIFLRVLERNKIMLFLKHYLKLKELRRIPGILKSESRRPDKISKRMRIRIGIGMSHSKPLIPNRLVG